MKVVWLTVSVSDTDWPASDVWASLISGEHTGFPSGMCEVCVP